VVEKVEEKAAAPELPVAAAEKPAEKPAAEKCSVRSPSHMECLRKANFEPAALMKCGQTMLACLSGSLNVEEWW